MNFGLRINDALYLTAAIAGVAVTFTSDDPAATSIGVVIFLGILFFGSKAVSEHVESKKRKTRLEQQYQSNREEPREN